MATTLTSTIVNVNIAKLKKDLEALGDIRVKSIRPKTGIVDTTVILTKGDGFTNLSPAQIISAQAVIDAHVDQQLENVRLLGETEFRFGTRLTGGETVVQSNGDDIWKFDSNNDFLPIGSRNIGNGTDRINEFFGIDANFSGDVLITGNLQVDGTLTWINTTNLEITDNEILLNAGWTGSPTLDAGITIERDVSNDAKLLWNETTDKWTAGDSGDMQNIIRQTEFDNHVNNTSNPHSVTKTQVGLGNVTNDAQLKRAAGDFDTFTLKVTPSGSDLILIEDSADSNNKKKINISSISGGGTAVENEIPSGTINGSNVSFTLANNYITGSVKLYLNGVRLTPGGLEDFVEGGTNVIVMNYAPETGDKLICDYRI